MLDCAWSNKEPGLGVGEWERSQEHKGEEEIPPVGLGETFLKK